MEIEIIDVGDRSVGLADLLTAKITLDDSMVEVLKEDKNIVNFAKDLKALIEKYCQPENGYEYELDCDTMKYLYGDDVFDYY